MIKFLIIYLLVFLFSLKNLFSQAVDGTFLFAKTVNNSKYLNSKDFSNNKVLQKTNYYSLYYSDSLSVFKEFQKNINDIDNFEGLFFTDFRKLKFNRYFELNNKKYYLSQNFKSYRWKITNESKKILNFTCYKAVTFLPKNNFSNSNNSFLVKPLQIEIVVWFTYNLPFPIGPSDFNSLPGAILEVSIDKNTIQYKAIQYKRNVSNSILATPQNHILIDEKKYTELIIKHLKASYKRF